MSQLGVIQPALGFGAAHADHEVREGGRDPAKNAAGSAVALLGQHKGGFPLLPAPRQQEFTSFSVHGHVVLVF